MNLAALSMLTLSLGLAEPSSDVIPTNSRIHKLQIDYKPEQRKQIQRVELCVSTDQGGVWKVTDAVTPDKDHLLLKAAADGTYWVKMVIVFRDGTREPADVMKMQPDFKMLIDSTLPVVRVNATRAGDEIVMDWTIDEQHPNDTATQVVYRGVGPLGGEWQPVPPGSIIKRTAKFKPTVTGPLVVQVVAIDQVGNQGFGAKEIAGTVTSTTTAFTPTVPNAIPAGNTGPVMPAPVMAPPGTGPSIPAGPIPPPNLEPSNVAPVAPVIGGNAAPVPSAPAPMVTANPGPAAPVNVPPAAAQPIANNPAPVPAPFTPMNAQPVTPVAGGVTPMPLPVTNASEVRTNPNWNSTGNVMPTAEPAPQNPNVQSINFLRFDLQYQLDNGPSGIARIDLYATRDEGRTWLKWSEHDGRQQPLKVALDTAMNQQREGDYGFRLVPVSGAGLSDGAPVSGTAPELRINVDLTPPLIRPFMPTADANQRNTLTLLWEATDKNFGPNPIAIDWSEAPTGPWKSVNTPEPANTLAAMPLPVAGQPAAAPQATPSPRLPNTGSFAWQLPATMATHKVYLKFTAWDSAGNKSEVITQSPVMVDLVKPKARIQGITSPTISGKP
jgi:hypothetical protein